MFRYFLVVLTIWLVSCGPPVPRAIRLGQEECAHCRMSIVETKYAAQLVTAKGRTYVFDDLACMIGFLTENPEIARTKPKLFAADAEQPATWLSAEQAHFVRNPDYHTPMNGQTVAFTTAAAAQTAQEALTQPGQLLSWNELSKIFASR